MRVAMLIVSTVIAVAASTQGVPEPRPADRATALRRHGLDPTTSLESRIAEAPDSVLEMFAGAGMGSPTRHALTEPERHTLSATFAALPPLHRRILRDRLRRISFLDGMPNTALTATINPQDPYRLFDITIRASIFDETIAGWLTQKERTCYVPSDGSLEVTIEAGSLDAILYVMLHEGTHIVDGSLELTPSTRADETGRAPAATAFTDGIWIDRLLAAPRYRDSLLQRSCFRTDGETLPIEQAEAVYAALGRTPFVSLYGSRNWHDDLAEYVAVYHLTEKLDQPYRIVLRGSGPQPLTYEPMKSPLVRQRIGQMARFYESTVGSSSNHPEN